MGEHMLKWREAILLSLYRYPLVDPKTDEKLQSAESALM
jgi:hypothetical protein